MGEAGHGASSPSSTPSVGGGGAPQPAPSTAQSVMPATAFESSLREISYLARREETGIDRGPDNVGRRQFLTQWVTGRRSGGS
ncbi:MAG: hypothetical protein IIC50_22190 [Planctomycetes bacterium]|nr:hypothetical protein [Planctomycetota bacterium]